ncbi:50S ribosomal protein L5 [bacterium]|nr:50S ribosomal protein L5 [bacterium]
MARLLEVYKKEIVPKLMKQFKYKNVMEVPYIQKIVVNMGLSEAKDDIKIIDRARGELAAITGQNPLITKAKKSISNFKLREGVPIGAKVTLRSRRMYEFLDRLINAALPRIRDFKGISRKAFDKEGNYNLGIREQSIFPEIKADKVEKTRGLNITIVIGSKSIEESRELLNLFGMPFRKK